jgi:hypothetical protein
MRSDCERIRRVIEAVYILCVLTSLAVAVLLLRAYHRTGMRILLWTGLGFVGLCLNNVLLITDHLLGTRADLSAVRNIPALIGMSLMVFGLIWKSE